jgi:hypothetical protein
LSTVTTCCVSPVAAACFFAASIALSCCDAHPAIIATPSTKTAPARSQVARTNKFAFIVSPHLFRAVRLSDARRRALLRVEQGGAGTDRSRLRNPSLQ